MTAYFMNSMTFNLLIFDRSIRLVIGHNGLDTFFG
jgi:hypothetical protein